MFKMVPLEDEKDKLYLCVGYEGNFEVLKVTAISCSTVMTDEIGDFDHHMYDIAQIYKNTFVTVGTQGMHII